MTKNPDQHGAKEARARLQKVLGAAFTGSPTQLKDIPKRSGKPRAAKRPRTDTRLGQ